MVADLVVDTEMLIETGAQLAIVAWKGRREKMRDGIENLAELTGAVGTELAGIDGDLASSLEEGK